MLQQFLYGDHFEIQKMFSVHKFIYLYYVAYSPYIDNTTTNHIVGVLRGKNYIIFMNWPIPTFLQGKFS